MRNFFIGFLLLSSFPLSGQIIDQEAWCPSGTRWVYNVITTTGNHFREYIYTKDTSFFHQSYKVVQARNITIENNIRSVSTLSAAHIYLRNENEHIYRYFPEQDSSVLLYVFGLQVGDSLVIRSNDVCLNTEDFPQYPDSSVLLVSQVGTITKDNRTFSIYGTNEVSQPHTLGTMVHHIGSLTHFLPSINLSYCYNDPSEFLDIGLGKEERLSCYYDDVRGYVSFYPNADFSCQYIITSTKEATPSSVQLFPNPGKDFIQIQGLQEVTVEQLVVFDLLGKQLKTFTHIASETNNNISDLPNGVYVIGLYKNQQLIHRLKLIKE